MIQITCHAAFCRKNATYAVQVMAEDGSLKHAHEYCDDHTKAQVMFSDWSDVVIIHHIEAGK